MTQDAYVRRATLVRAVDGDTFDLRIDLGYRVECRVMGRLRGYNAAELRDPNGDRDRVRAEAILTQAHSLLVRSYKDQMSFARWIVDIEVDGVDLVDLLTAPVSPLVDAS